MASVYTAVIYPGRFYMPDPESENTAYLLGVFSTYEAAEEAINEAINEHLVDGHCRPQCPVRPCKAGWLRHAEIKEWTLQ